MKIKYLDLFGAKSLIFVSIVLVFINMKSPEDIDYRAATNPYSSFMPITKRLFSAGGFSPVLRHESWQVELRFSFTPSAWGLYALFTCHVISLIPLFMISFSDRTHLCFSSSLNLNFPIVSYHCHH